MDYFALSRELLTALEWALKHAPKHGTATYELNREFALRAVREAREDIDDAKRHIATT